VKGPETYGGWGEGLPTSLSDLVLLRRAINEDWPVPDNVRRAIIRELEGEFESPNARVQVSIVKSFLAMEDANLRDIRLG
jgi:uncharacterized protein (UPF0147 family)